MDGNEMISNDAMVSVLSAKLDALTARFDKQDAQFATFISAYTRSDVLNLRFKELEDRIHANKLAILRLERQKTLMTWLYPTISAILGSVLTFLVISYLSSH